MTSTAIQRIKLGFNPYRVAAWSPVPTLWRLAWQRNILDREYRRALAAVEDDPHERRTLQGRFQIDFDMLDEEIASWYPLRLAKKARCLHVPLPPVEDKECWSWGH